MRIISKFDDYYDIGMGLGHDSSLIYLRESMEINFKSLDLTEQEKETKKLFKKFPACPLSHSMGYEIIGFCGKFYPVIIFPQGINKLKYPLELCFSLGEVDVVLANRLSSKDFKGWMDISYSYSRRKKLDQFFKECESIRDINTFIINRCPIVALNSGKGAIWNPRLRDYNFARVVGPYEAFQEIEMFIGNLAIPEKPVPPRTDIEKIESHGFDKKISFRKGKNKE